MSMHEFRDDIDAPAKSGELRVLLADEAPPTLRTLRKELQQLPGLQIVAEVQSSHDALDLIVRIQPDVVVASVTLPSEGGFGVLRLVKRAAPNCAVILTNRLRNAFVEDAGRLLGAAAICQIPGDFTEICSIVQRLIRAKQGGGNA
jgi:two-component system invasion response regulator UvrY